MTGDPALVSLATIVRGADTAKRDASLDAALALFAERTFEGTPVPLIAERAGVGERVRWLGFRGDVADYIAAAVRQVHAELMG